MRSLAVLVIAIQMSIISGRVTIFKEVYKKKFCCVSEDDGGGLIWNRYFKCNHYRLCIGRGEKIDFEYLNPYQKGKIDCELNSYDNCTSSWDTLNWEVTNSQETPMGPVIDRRWEDFIEYNYLMATNQHKLHMSKLKESGAIVISIRASNDINILLCNSTNYANDKCYWIIIGGWDNTESAVRKCVNGVPNPTSFAQDESCKRQRVSYAHRPLSLIEWRTFILTWNKSTRNISLYDTNKLILTYVDTEEYAHYETPIFNHLFLSSRRSMLARFHNYTFLHAIDSNAALTSPILNLHSINLCLEMIIGLCVECQMKVVLVSTIDKNEIESLETIKGSTVASAHSLAMWQYVKIERKISFKAGTTAKVKLIPGLERQSSNPLWAVANIRQCPPVGTIRYSCMVDTNDYSYGEDREDPTCQKLFYNENTTVSSAADTFTDVKFDEPTCPEGNLGPHCSINCVNHLEESNTCKGIAICEKMGCSCAPGYTGNYCYRDCAFGKYGHNCNQLCGRCINGNCNPRTGECISGCDNSERYNIPPFCQIAIDTLPSPTIDFVNETIVRASLPLAEEFTLTPSNYVFLIQKEGESSSRYIGHRTPIFKNTTILIGYTEGLEPGMSYKISCIIYAGETAYRIHGKWQNFSTLCTPSTEFEIEITNTSLTVAMSQKVKINSCPTSWYDILLESNETNVIRNEKLTQFPHQFKNLLPYTSYKITIGKGEELFFWRIVRTYDGVPSKVSSLHNELTRNKEVTLWWQTPKYSNGIIAKYRVTLQIETYSGCLNLARPSPRGNIISTTTMSTNITFSELVPFADYIARVAACTSYCGPERSSKFSTEQSEMPTSTYSNLRFESHTLKWDPPKDCTTISGSTITRIIFTGLSSAVMNFSIQKQTKNNFYKLDQMFCGVETYEARVYVIRDFHKPHNQSLYEKLVFTTPPQAPPPVRNLEIIEIDDKTQNVYLRWQDPEPPINGEIQFYSVFACFANWCDILLRVPPTQRCKLWDNYMCATLEQFDQNRNKIKVHAVNVNVSTPGDAEIVTIPNARIIPEAPEILNIEPLQTGIVNVTWSHPWRTGGHLNRFILRVKMRSSDLRNEMGITRESTPYYFSYAVKEYQLQYNELLYLLPSSTYTISIYAETNTNVRGKLSKQQVQTPLAIAFEGEMTLEIYRDSSIVVRVPAVINDTTDSTMSVILKGPRPCKYSKNVSSYVCEKIGIQDCKNAWLAATFPTNQFANKSFTVGDNEIYDSATNCQLKQQESYVIMVIVQTDEKSMNGQIIFTKTTSIRIGEDSQKRGEVWLILIAIFFVLACIAFYLYRRYKRRSLTKSTLQEEMALAYNSDRLDAKSAFKNSKHSLIPTPTPSDKETLSRPSTPHDDEPILGNDVSRKEERSTLVKVKDIEDYVKQAIESGLLYKQYNTLPRGKTKSWEYGMLPENKQKNRYGNLIAYDENRVILQKIPNDPYSDYINASYITGYQKKKWYIATQGPKPNTVIDFWRMIWQEETLIICMLSNIIEDGKTKCEQYWPDIGKKKKYGDVVVLNVKHTVFADYTFRTLLVTYEEETRKIEHLHYTAWPDHGIPLSTHSVVTYLKKLLATSPGNGPVVVHCSAGVGRTGTIILCDVCLRRAAAEGVVDVFTETESIRSQRANMVDTKQQYLLAHLALVECLLSFPTSLPCDEALPMKINELKKQLPTQQRSLLKTIWQDEALRPSVPNQVSLSERNLKKNRYPELVSEKVSRVYLKRYPTSDEDSDYISAVYVDGVRLQNQYLAAQLPLPTTLSDFWRMVAEYQVELIVMLQQPDPNDPTCCPIVPCEEFKPLPYINIRAKESNEYEFYTSQKLTLVDNGEKPAREQQVTILCSTEWKPGRNQKPPATAALVTLWQAVERISRDGPTVALCHDGVTGCGLYLALSFLLERMAVERECDVCLAIRAIRRSRPDFVQSLEHMEYLYDAAETYLKYFETYANFT